MKIDGFLKKIIMIIILTILLTIPVTIISFLISGRERLYEQTVTEIGSSWGEKQKVMPPFLVVKYVELTSDNTKIEKEIVVLPEELKLDISLDTEQRNRGIYKANVYTANLVAKGNFNVNKIKEYLFEKNIKEISSLFLSMGVKDQSKIVNIESFKIDSLEEKSNVKSGTNSKKLLTGISNKLSNKDFLEKNILSFDINMSFRGSINISILPTGEFNEVNIDSNWGEPSFSGILPLEKNIENNSFKAKWETIGLVRSYPQILEEEMIDNFSQLNFDIYSQPEYEYYGENEEYSRKDEINLKLFSTINNYTQINRATKYSILFIMLTIIVVFIFEVISKKKTHLVQYILIGVSLSIFYLILLSSSEHIGFNLAYLLSSIAIIIPNSIYLASISSNKKLGIIMFAFLVSLYTILYSILQMEQYALLVGSLLILLLLYILMYLTRNIEKFIQE